MISRSQRALMGLLAAGALSLPAFSVAFAAPAKKAPPKKKPAPTKPAPAKGDAKMGKDQFKSEGCTGCHKTADFKDGGTTGPDLSQIGTKSKENLILDVIMHPKPTSGMMPVKDRKTALNLTSYLLTQK